MRMVPSCGEARLSTAPRARRVPHDKGGRRDGCPGAQPYHMDERSPTVFESILIPTDGSSTSDQALEKGLELARLAGARVTFLHVLENPLTSGYATPEAMPYAAQLYTDLRTSGENILQRAVQRAEALGVAATSRMVEDADPVR